MQRLTWLQSLFLRRCHTPAYCGFTRSQRRGQHAGPTSSTTIFQASPVLRWRVYCFHHNFQLLSNYSFNSLHTARPWFRACGLRGRVWARPAGRRRRTTVHAPTAFIMERTQSPVSSSWDTSDSTEPKPRLQSTISTATTPQSIWLFMDASGLRACGYLRAGPPRECPLPRRRLL